MIVKVDVQEGEEGTWMSEVGTEDIGKLLPLLGEIKKHDGYFPTGQYLKEPDPKPEILYSHLPGWPILVSRLPTPRSGIRKILEIHFLPGPLKSLYM